MAVPVLETFLSGFSKGLNNLYVIATKPSGVQVGDLLVLFAGHDNNNNNRQFSAITSESGWTLQSGPDSGGAADVWFGCYTKIADGTEAATVQAPFGGANHASDTLWFYARFSGATGVDVKGTPLIQHTSTSTHTIPGVTTTVDDCLAIYGLMTDEQSAPFSVAGSWTEQGELETDRAGNGMAGCFGTLGQATAGATGDAVVTSDFTTGSVGIVIALAPAAAAGHTASGTPSLTITTAAGAATRILPASGSPSASAVTGTGAGTRVTKPVAAADAPAATASADAAVARQASGSADVAPPQPSAAAGIRRQASADATAPAATSAGNAVDRLPATGAAVTAAASAAAAAFAHRAASGAAVVVAPAGAGAAQRLAPAYGVASVSPPVPAAAAVRLLPASGAADIPAAASAAAATRVSFANADATLTAAYAESGAFVVRLGAGAATLPAPIPSGNAAISDILTAAGSVTVSVTAATGETAVRRVAVGAVSIRRLTAKGGFPQWAKANRSKMAQKLFFPKQPDYRSPLLRRPLKPK